MSSLAFWKAVVADERRDGLDLGLPLAAPWDLVRLKIAAALEPIRCARVRQEDFCHISGLIESFPTPLGELPREITRRLVE